MARRYNNRGNSARRAPLRKFVWARTRGTLSGPATLGANLLDVFQAEYGAQLLGSTVMRVRGYVLPFPSGPGPYSVQGTVGIIVENDNELDQQDVLLDTPAARPHDDWLAWLPFSVRVASDGVVPAQEASWGPGSPWAVDVKSARKIEELGEGLHIWYDFVTGTEQDLDIQYDLSVGLKLP